MVPVVPILAILICGYMMYGLPNDTWWRLIIWLVIGLVIYFGYGRTHSRVGRSDAAAAQAR
jgi:APA family basic amino acid/polyamine antiporter